MDLMKPAEVAKQVGVSVRTLGRWRETGKGPPAYKITSRTIRYKRSEVEQYLRTGDLPPGFPMTEPTDQIMTIADIEYWVPRIVPGVEFVWVSEDGVVVMVQIEGPGIDDTHVVATRLTLQKHGLSHVHWRITRKADR